MARLMREVIKEGMTTSKPYMGFSWYDPITNVAIAYPMPLNWIVRWTRSIYLAMAFPSRTKVEKYMQAALMERWREGKAMGIAIGRSQIYDEIRAELARTNSRETALSLTDNDRK